MATRGQPTLYKPEYCEFAHNYCLLGATNEVLAGFFDVAPACCPWRVISYPCHGTQKFVLLRAEPTRRERCDESVRHAGD
jgi:hypothetical protein